MGAVSQAHGKVALALAAPVREAARTLPEARVKNVDETRYPREGSTGQWVWGVVRPKVVVFNLPPSRARYVIHGLLGEAAAAPHPARTRARHRANGVPSHRGHLRATA